MISFGQLVALLSTEDADKICIWSTSLSIVGSVALAWLSVLDHRLAVRPSDLSVLYLLAGVIGDLIWLMYPMSTECQLRDLAAKRFVMVDSVTRTVLLILECQEKPAIPSIKKKDLHPEETSGVLSTTFFWWMNSILALGNSRILSVDDTPHLDTRINPRLARNELLIRWQQRGLL